MTKNKDLVAKLLDNFYQKIAVEKKAADDSAKKEKEGVTVVESPAQGAAGTEKKTDVTDAVGGVAASDPAAQVKEGDAAVNTQGPKSLAADEKVNEADNKIKQVETAEKVARAEVLGSEILKRISALQKSAEAPAVEKPIEKAATVEKTAEEIAAGQAFDDFKAGFLRGVEKRAEDLKEFMASGLVKEAQVADAVLDDVAIKNPEAVLPEEVLAAAPAAAEGGPNPEEAAVLDQLAQEMAAQGVTPEDLMQAAQVVEELKQAGVSPEEIVQAAAEVGGEGAPAEAAPEAAEKVAAERKDAIKDVIRSLRKA